MLFFCVLEHSGPPDPLHGSAPYLSVRQEAKVKTTAVTLTTVTTNDDVIFIFL